MSGTGDRFQQVTKYEQGKMPDHKLDWEAKPDLYKEYPQAEKIELPGFEPARAMSLDQTLKQRKSIRDFQDKPISKGQLAYLLWASTGIQRAEDGYEFRTAPSAGALYPIETYVVANNIKSLEPGVYHYAIRSHQLEQLEKRDLRRQIAAAALGQGMCAGRQPEPRHMRDRRTLRRPRKRNHRHRRHQRKRHLHGRGWRASLMLSRLTAGLYQTT